MANYVINQSRINEPVYYQVRQNIRKGAKTSDIIERVQHWYKGTRESTVIRYIDYLKGTQSAARKLNRSSDRRDFMEVIESSRTKQPKVARVYYQFRFRGEDNKPRSRGFFIDLETAGLTVGDVRAAIQSAVDDWIQSNYDIRKSNVGQSGYARRTLQINEIEGM